MLTNGRHRCKIRNYRGLNLQSLVQIQKLWILYSESLIPKYEYGTFKFDINSCDLEDKMKKILHVILISLLSFTVVSCAKKDDAETDSASSNGKIIVYAVNYSL